MKRGGVLHTRSLILSTSTRLLRLPVFPSLRYICVPILDILSPNMLRGLFRIHLLDFFGIGLGLGFGALILVSLGKVVAVTMMSRGKEHNTSHHNLPLPVNTGTGTGTAAAAAAED